MRRRDVVFIAVIIILLLLLLWCLCTKMIKPPRYQPSVGVYGGVDVVVLEDFVSVEDGRYVVRSTAVGRFSQIPVWGGWSVSANITYSTLAVNLDGGGVVLVFGVASRNSTLNQDLGNGFRIYADGNGGYVVYNGTFAGWCLRRPVYYDGVYVWLPASTCNINVQYRITVEPSWGGVFVNGRQAEVVNVDLVKVSGVLPGWYVHANQSGVYYFTAKP